MKKSNRKYNGKLNRLIILVGGSLVICSSAFAQSSFEGFYGHVGIGYGITKPTDSKGSGTFQFGGQGPSYPFSYVTKDSTSKTPLGVVGVGYYATVRDNFVLGIGAEFVDNKRKWTKDLTTNSFGVTQEGKYEITHSYNIFISPAYAIDKDKLIYGKLGYMSSDTKIFEPGSVDPIDVNKGYSLGLGYKQIITGGWYGFVEGNYFVTKNQPYSNSGTINGNKYSSTSTADSKSYQILTGVGYQF